MKSSIKPFAILCIGYSCSGKSTISRHLNTALKKEFSVDTEIYSGDDLIKKLSIKSFDMPTRISVAPDVVKKIQSKLQNGKTVIIDRGNPLVYERSLFKEFVPRLVQVYVKCPLIICIYRDFLRSIRRGSPVKPFVYVRSFLCKFLSKHKQFYLQGVNLPFEAPTDADIVIETHSLAPEIATETIINYLKKQKYLPNIG